MTRSKDDEVVIPLMNIRPDEQLRLPPSPLSGASSRRHATTLTGSYALLSREETAFQLQTSLSHGLSSQDAQKRMHDHGPNELPSEEPEPLWLRFLKQFKETLILLLLGSAVVSLIVGNKDDAISIAIAVTIVVTVGFVQEYRSEQSLEALSKLVPHFANLIRGGIIASEGYTNGSAGGSTAAQRASSTVAASQLVPGDLVVFSTGDRIPADLRITIAADLSIDESNLTGENEAVIKTADVIQSKDTRQGLREDSPGSGYRTPAMGSVGADVRLNEQNNIAFMGTLVRSGHGQGVVVATGAKTEFGAISASLQEIESPRTPLQAAMDKLGQELSYVSFAVIGIIVLVGLLQGVSFLAMFTTGVSLAVAAIPEGLPIIVTVTLALGVLRMANRGAIVRRLPSVETLGSVNVVCSDKTGTLTQNHMTVTMIWHSDLQDAIDIKRGVASDLLDSASKTILRIGNIANNARLSQKASASPATAASAAVLSSTEGNESTTVSQSRWVGQPTDVAMLDLLDNCGEDDARERLGDRTTETPFSSERKWMGVVHRAPGATSGPETAFVKGALERVIQRCDTYLTREGREIVLDETRRQAAFAAAEKMASEGLRVLAFANATLRDSTQARNSGPGSRSVTPLAGERPKNEAEDLYHGLAFAGLVGMNDPPRKGVGKAIRRLMAGGVKVVMITGDAETTALAIAKQLDMHIPPHRGVGASDFGVVLRGDQLDRMSEQELSQAIARTSIFARTSPEHKLKIIRAYQARGDVVAMTGDGVNDAPALKKADIGISMGVMGTDVAKEAADMILTDDNFATILSAIEEGKGIFYNVQNFLTFQLSTSVAALSLTLISTILRFKQPLNPMQILWISKCISDVPLVCGR